MTFGISAVQAIGLAVAAGAAAYGADKQRKAVHGQSDAVNAAQRQQAIDAQNAETQAQLDANTKTAEARRRRRNTALGGGGQTDLLGGPSPASVGDSSLATRAAQLVAGIGPRYTSTALGGGGGSSAVSAPRAAVPTRPSRESAL